MKKRNKHDHKNIKTEKTIDSSRNEKTIKSVRIYLLASIISAISPNTSLAKNIDIEKKRETLCSGVDLFDTSPDRPLKFGHETNLLLLLTKPYIGEKQGEGILSKWQFNNQGRVFTGEISESAKWSDESAVTPLEAATGIIVGLKNRAIGKVLKLRGNEDLPTFSEVLSNPARYINIIDKKTFAIEFDGNVENLNGALREALSANSRINRVWPTRIQNGKKAIDLVSKVNIVWSNGEPEIKLSSKHTIVISNQKSGCENAEYYLSSSLTKRSRDEFDTKFSAQQQILIAILNPFQTISDSLEKRRKLISKIRGDLSSLKDNEFTPTNTLFLRGEPGFSGEERTEAVHSSAEINLSSKLKIQPWTKLPNTWRVKNHLVSEKNDYEFTDPSDSSAPIYLVVAPVTIKGQQISLQNGSTFAKIESYRKTYPNTFDAMKQIQTTSSSTLPKRHDVFLKLERAIADELSLMPILRFRIALLTKKSAEMSLDWNENGEIELKERNSK
jgi:hypothetical protein